MEQSEEAKIAKDILQSIIKAKKTLRMYPQDNPVYVKTLHDSFTKFKNYFDYNDTYILKIGQHSIYFDSEEIYQNPEKEDNLALLFFKDGIRELTFEKGLLQEELEEFLKIISLDFEREAYDDDVVTLMWERDFRNIKYVVDETVLMDADVEEYEAQAINQAKQEVSDIDGLMKAYGDEFKKDVQDMPVIPLSDKDLQILMRELEKDWSNKLEKLSEIIFEMFYQSVEIEGLFEDTLRFLKDTIRFLMEQGDINIIINIMKKSREVLEDPVSTEEMKKYARLLLAYPGKEEVISLFGELLNSGVPIDDDDLKGFIELLDESAITPLVKVLGELKTLRVREKITEALIRLGRKDIRTLAKALNDERWYVVRTIIHILRTIGDKRAIEYFLNGIRHTDVRVRKEAIRSLGELGSQEVLQHLRECLYDPDEGIRIAAAEAIGAIGSEEAKKIILKKILDKTFNEGDIEEKKKIYEVLSRWKDLEVFNFLIGILKKKPFFKKAETYENWACAAFGLGLLGNKDALPFLYKHRESKDKLLREFSQIAIRRIEHGQ